MPAMDGDGGVLAGLRLALKTPTGHRRALVLQPALSLHERCDEGDFELLALVGPVCEPQSQGQWDEPDRDSQAGNESAQSIRNSAGDHGDH
jgi:hypothetical protein